MAKRSHVGWRASDCGLRETPTAIRAQGGSETVESTSLASFQSEDILIGAHEAIPTIDFLSEGRNDRLPFEFEAVQLVYALDNLRDVERLASASEYVMYHIDLRRTFAGSLRLARFCTQTADG